MGPSVLAVANVSWLPNPVVPLVCSRRIQAALIPLPIKSADDSSIEASDRSEEVGNPLPLPQPL